MRIRMWVPIGIGLVLGALLASAGAALAAPSAYTSAVAFGAALPGPAAAVGFDELPSGHVINSGATVSGIAFEYDFQDVQLVATPGTLDGSGGGFTTTSAPHVLGTSDLDVLMDGDDLALGLAASNALGLFVVTAETPGVSLFDGDIRLTAGGATVSLDVDDVQATLADGSRVFFLGIVDPAATFSAAALGTFGEGGEFVFNVDDVVTALPEPGLTGTLVPGLLALSARGRRRDRSVEGEGKERPWHA